MISSVLVIELKVIVLVGVFGCLEMTFLAVGGEIGERMDFLGA